ncbi:hypothetical protein UMC2_15241 [[Clostridium] sordellii]|uniref:DUF4854 domain-containing protein n=1 Tax=Paraclostridium sordellii TaxID=1505 RepID=UPI0005439F86|nr:DUF4854 domain-containing protein [Paeniclostridium sordellii]CEK34274.1 hypothetical protein UMC2_15241 [[Clostridium] sordellii] [Paeniclostridium sordellii]
MKKVLPYFLAIIVSLSLVGCNSKKTETKSQNSNTTNKQEVKKTNGEFSTVEELVNNPIVKSQFEKKAKDGLSISAKGNNLIYTCKYPEQVEVNEEFVNTLKEAVKKEEGTFQSMGKDILDDVDTNEIKVYLKYVNADGSEIYTHEIVCKK